MPDLIADTVPAAIIANVVAVLQGATVPTNQPVFVSVLTVDDEALFQRIADPSKGPVAGVAARPPRYTRGPFDGIAAQYRLDLRILYRFADNRAAGTGDGAAVAQMQSLASLIKTALSADKTRGGLTGWVKFAGQVLEPTDLRGEPRMLPGRPNASYRTAVLPVACAWTVS